MTAPKSSPRHSNHVYTSILTNTNLRSTRKNAHETNIEILDAIVTIAHGDFTASRFVSTLTQLGEWTNDRPIYVITDKVRFGCRHQWDNYDPSNCEHDITFIDSLSITPQFSSRQEEEAWDKEQSLKAKWYKTKLFDVIPESIQTVLYIDADVEVRSPISYFERDVASFLQSSSSSSKPSCHAYYFEERMIEQLASHMKYNSGIAIYTRHESQKLLHQWGKLLLSMNYNRDQTALKRAIEMTHSTVCTLPSNHLQFQAQVLGKWWSKRLHDNYETYDGHPPTFYHYTSFKSLHRMRIPYNGTLFD